MTITMVSSKRWGGRGGGTGLDAGKGKVSENRKVNGSDGGLEEDFNGALGWGCIVPLDR